MASFGDIGGIVGSALVGFIGGGAGAEYADMVEKEKQQSLAMRDQRLADLQLRNETAGNQQKSDLAGPTERGKLQAQADVANDPNNVQAGIDATNKRLQGTQDAQATYDQAIERAKEKGKAEGGGVKLSPNESLFNPDGSLIVTAPDVPGNSALKDSEVAKNNAISNYYETQKGGDKTGIQLRIDHDPATNQTTYVDEHSGAYGYQVAGKPAVKGSKGFWWWQKDQPDQPAQPAHIEWHAPNGNVIDDPGSLYPSVIKRGQQVAGGGSSTSDGPPQGEFENFIASLDKRGFNVGKGLTSDSAVDLPQKRDASSMKAGQIYNTSRGLALWDGSKFIQ